MHIAINASLLNSSGTYRSAGVSRYSAHLLQHVGNVSQCQGTVHRITAFLHTDETCGGVLARSRDRGMELIPVDLPLHNPLVRIAWEQIALPRQLQRIRADVVHGLVNVLPLTAATPGVVTVHDLSFLRVPHLLPRAKRVYQARLCAASVRRARRVIAVSQQTADDLMAFFGTDAAKISVIYNGVAETFRPAANAADTAAFRQRNGLPTRFVLHVGTLEPRKNLVRLLRAFAQYKAQTGPRSVDVKLVLAGGRGWFFQHLFAEVVRLRLEKEVFFPGFVPETELPDWYRAACACVYPSLLEGFGLPVLEAMACGTPVLCSRIASLMEVAADCAITFAPTDEMGLAAGLALVLEQPALRAELRQRGLARAAQFSWQRTAQETLSVYEKI